MKWKTNHCECASVKYQRSLLPKAFRYELNRYILLSVSTTLPKIVIRKWNDAMMIRWYTWRSMYLTSHSFYTWPQHMSPANHTSTTHTHTHTRTALNVYSMYYDMSAESTSKMCVSWRDLTIHFRFNICQQRRHILVIKINDNDFIGLTCAKTTSKNDGLTLRFLTTI